MIELRLRMQCDVFHSPSRGYASGAADSIDVLMRPDVGM
jgi:hypothetical protein